jgi:transmembrane sensor
MDQKKSIKAKIIAYLDGDISREDLRELSLWISKSKENARFYVKVKDIWEASLGTSINSAKQNAEIESEWKKFLSSVKSKESNARSERIRSISVHFSKIAAVLIIGAITGGFLFNHFRKENTQPLSFFASKGSVSKVILPDSSVIFLNSGSEIKYSAYHHGKSRQVYLKGEAMFKVKNIHNTPFVVHTDIYDVNVTGTEFNVRAYPDDKIVETTLKKGSVTITSSEDHAINHNIALRPGEQMVYNREQQSINVEKVNTDLYTSWEEESFTFNKLSLAELVVLIERKYNVSISIKNSEILNYHYSGTINKESIYELLDIIKETLPIEYKVDKTNITISEE